MKSNSTRNLFLIINLLIFGGGAYVHAVNVTKLNTATMNGGAVDWSAAPATTDVGEFGATPSSVNLAAMALGGNLTLGGLQLDGTMNGPLIISAGSTLTLGTSGINMSAANFNCTINCAVSCGTSANTWTVVSGRTVTLGSTVGFGNGGTLIMAGAGNFNYSLGSASLSTGNGTGNIGVTTTGTVTVNDVNIGKNSASTTTVPTAASPVNAPGASGFYVSGANAVVNLNTLELSTQNGSCSALISAGSTTVSGAVLNGRSNSGSTTATGRGTYFQVSGGSFTVSDTTSGVIMSPNQLAGGNQNLSEFYVSGGTASLGKITFGASTDVNAGIGFVLVKGGTLYIGSGGIVRATTISGYASTVSLFSGTLGASNTWSSSHPIVLSGTAGTPFVIQTADALNVSKDIALSGIVSGSGSLTKTGSGTLTLGGANSYAGDTTVSAGVLKLSAAGVIPDGASTGNLTVNGTFDLNTFNETINGLSGSGTVDNLAAGTPTLTVGANNQTSLFSGVVTNSLGTLAIIKTGTGVVGLTGLNTYNGDTTVSGGTLTLGSQPGSTNFTVASSTILNNVAGLSLSFGKLLGGSGSVTGAVTAANGSFLRPGGSGSAGTLTLSNNLMLSGATTNLFDLANVNTEGAGVNDEIIAGGNVSLSGNNFIILNLLNGSLANGSYKLIKYAGTLTGGTNNLTLVGFVSGTGQTAALSTNTPGEIDLVVTAATGSADLVWKGDGGNNFWDNGTTSNFLNGVLVAAFNTNDLVTFNDSSTNQTIKLVGGLIPQTVTVNSTSNYIFSGTGKLTSTASLIKTNTGTLTVLTTNDFSGSVAIDGGALQVGNGATSGNIGVGVVINNSTLTYNLPDDATVVNNISGTGTLTKQSGDTLTVSGGNSFVGNVLIQNGTMKLGSATALGTTVGITVVSNAATLDLNAQTIGAETIVITGTGVGGNGALVNNSGSASHGGLVSLAADSTIGGSGNATLSGTVGGGFNLTKAGNGTLTITGANTNTGKTIITGGTLSVSADAKLGAAPIAIVADQVTINGGTLATTATFTGAATRDITIGANGGTIDVASGTTFSYGDIVQGAGTLTKAGAGTLELTQSGIDHTYGGLILNAGTLAINKSTGLGTGTVLLNGGTIKTDTTASRSPGNNIVLNGSVTLGASGAGTLNFGGNWTITNASQTLTIDTTTTTINGVIGQDTAGRGLVKAGSGLLALAAANTFSGGLTMNAGTLVLSNSSALGTGILTRVGGLVQLADGVVITNTWQQGSTDTSDSQMDVPVAGSFGIWTGPIFCPNSDQFRCAGSGGTLTISNSTVGLGSSIFVVSRGNVNFAGNTILTCTGSGLLGRPNSSSITTSITVRNNASISLGAGSSLGGGKLSSTLALTLQDSANMNVAANFDINGSTTAGTVSSVNLNGGTLTVGTILKSLVSGVTTLSFNGGALKASANSATFLSSLSGLTALISMNGGIIDDGGFAVTVAQPLVHDTALGAIADGGLIKAGNGVLSLTAAETYTGNTAINAGSLALGVGGSLASTPIIAVAGGATFDVSAVGGYSLGGGQTLTGSGTVTGAVTAASGGIISAGIGKVGTLSFSNSLALNATSTNTFAVTSAGGASNKVVVAGALTPNGSVVKVTSGSPLLPGTNILFTYGSISGSFNPSVNFDVAPVHPAVLVDDGARINLVVPNQAPVANGNNYTRGGLNAWKISVSNLLANASDADGDAVTLVSVGTSTNGITLVVTGGYVQYYNTNLVDDQFSYTVTDGIGGTNSAIITLTAGSISGVGGQVNNFTANGGTASMSFAGIPGYLYHVQVSTNLSSWDTIWTTNAPANGLFQFNDGNAPQPDAYYRLMWNGN